MTWCWWCCHEIEGTPLHLPHKYDELRNKFSTLGLFCSWSCMKTYNIFSMPSHSMGITCGNIVMMRKKLYGIVGNIKSAPNRYHLKQFGGHMTIEEFREGATRDDGAASTNVEIVEKPVVNRVFHNCSKLAEISSSSGTNEQLRLKRSKPLKRDDNNLEKFLGITRKRSTPATLNA